MRMASLEDWVSHVTPQEREGVDSILRPTEYLCWAVRPQPRLRDCVRWDLFLFGLVWTAFVILGLLSWLDLVPISHDAVEIEDFVALGAFALVGLAILSAPLFQRRRIRRSLYLLTQRRAIILEPRWRGWRHYLWALNKRLLLRRSLEADGSGNLWFLREYYADGQNHRNGFLGLPDLAQAERRIATILSERQQSRGGESPAPATSKQVDDFLPDLSPAERDELNRALFADERGNIVWATRSLRGVVLGGVRDLMHIFTGDHHVFAQLYILTPRRALLLQPSLGGRWTTRAYPVHRDMVLSVRARQQGRGDLILEEDRGKNTTIYRGFMNLPNLAEAQRAFSKLTGK